MDLAWRVVGKEFLPMRLGFLRDERCLEPFGFAEFGILSFAQWMVGLQVNPHKMLQRIGEIGRKRCIPLCSRSSQRQMAKTVPSQHFPKKKERYNPLLLYPLL